MHTHRLPFNGTTRLALGQSVSDTFEAPAVFNSGGTYNATAVFSVQAPDASGFTGTQVGPLPLAVSTVVTGVPNRPPIPTPRLPTRDWSPRSGKRCTFTEGSWPPGLVKE